MMKDLYSTGESIPPYHVPSRMYAYVIHPDQHGVPLNAFKEEIIETPHLHDNEVLIRVKSAGVNYNGVWAALGQPLSPTVFHGHPFHIAGSDAAGIVWKIGQKVDRSKFPHKEGDEVILHCGQYCNQCEECLNGDPMLCDNQKIWGYETPFGSFAQFTAVKPYQILPKPANLSWAEAASYMLVLATAWRMLYGHAPHALKPEQNVLVWGGAGGIGSMAIQIIRNAGANPIAVVSSEERGKLCLELGAKGYINRHNFDCWGIPPKVNTPEYFTYLERVRKFGKAVWEIIGDKESPDIVIEHVGERTFAVSCYLAKKGGMVVYCGATSGFNLFMNAAYGWMHQKRIQGSHFASTKEAIKANQEVLMGNIRPILGKVCTWKELPEAHQLMYENKQPPGNIACIFE